MPTLTSTLSIADGLLRTNPGASDPYYDGGNGDGYATTAAVYAAIPVAVRKNKTFLLQVAGVPTEYWWQNTNTANGQEVLKNTGGGGSGSAGIWTAIGSKSSFIINEDIDFEYQVNDAGDAARNTVFIRAEFDLDSAFSGTSIVLGQLPTNALPKGTINKLFTNSNVNVELLIDNTGAISLFSKDGFVLPTLGAATDRYNIEAFFKAVAASGPLPPFPNLTGYNSTIDNDSVEIYDNTSTLILTAPMPRLASMTPIHFNPAAGPFGVDVLVGSAGVSATVNGVTQAGTGRLSFPGVGPVVNVQIA